MNITHINKTKAMQPAALQEAAQNAAREAKASEGGRDGKGRVDSAELSSGSVGLFSDKRLSAFKSSLLYELSSDASGKRVQELKEQVENGEYRVPSDILAEALYD